MVPAHAQKASNAPHATIRVPLPNTSTLLSVVLTHDPCQQAMYHYIATGTTLKAHMYRRRDDDQSIPEIEKFISEKLLKEMPEVNEVEIIEDDIEMHAEPEVNGEVDDDEN